MAKLELDIILLDESVVMHGFRALMNGAKLEGFLKNPVMLLQHNRPPGYNGSTDAILPIGKWYDIRIIDGKLLAKPDFDDNDEFAKKIESKVKGGYLNGASVWIDPVTCSDNEDLMLIGQCGPTITEWGVLEASIVDIPNCRNALAIRNSAGGKVMLSANAQDDENVLSYLKTLTTQSNNFMDKKALRTKLSLEDNATDEQVEAKLTAAVAAVNQNATLSAKVTSLETENEALKLAAEETKRATLVDTAVTEKKIQAGDRDKYMKLAAADFETTESLLKGMKAYESIESKLGANNGSHTDADKVELESLTKLSGHQLWKEGKLERLQQLDEAQFKLKFKEATGCEYTPSNK